VGLFEWSFLRCWNKAVTATVLLTGMTMISPDTMAAEAMPTPSEKAAMAAENTAPGSIAQAFFTTAVEDDAPVDFLSEIENSVSEVFFYCVFRGEHCEFARDRSDHRSVVFRFRDFQPSISPSGPCRRR
jgi:hypothetical protein